MIEHGDLKVTEFARIVQLHPESVRQMIRSGRFRFAYKIGHSWRIRKEAVDEVRGLKLVTNS